jgi:hypothetical protein
MNRLQEEITVAALMASLEAYGPQTPSRAQIVWQVEAGG